MKLYFAPRTRAVRIRWLLEELELPYELCTVEFAPPAEGFFRQKTPLGKLPVLEDGGVTLCESGAILEYVLERYGQGRLAPPIGSPERGPFLQWVHFAEATAFPPIGTLVLHELYRGDAGELPGVVETARGRARDGLDFLQEQLGGKPYLLGGAFSGADIMMGFTLAAARVVGLLDDRYAALARYLERLQARPAFQRAVAA